MLCSACALPYSLLPPPSSLLTMKIIFFDIGDVLFDENAQHQYLFHSMLLAMRRNGVDVTWDAYHARLRECVRVAPSTAYKDAVHAFVPDGERAEQIIHQGRGEYEAMRKPRPYGMLLDNMLAVVQDLKCDFRLGIIANQHPQIMDALKDYGLLPYFDVVAIDEIVGVSKPDPKIFQWALAQAGCEPKEAIMIGDRPDVDVAPARSLGMGTIRFQRGQLYVYYDPRTDQEHADVVVTDIMRLAPAAQELAVRRNGS